MGTYISSLQEQYVQDQEWSKIDSYFHGQPRVTTEVISTCSTVRTCLQGAHNILFDPEFEANLLKLPQILPSASLASLLQYDQAENTSWKTQDELKALPPQATEIDNRPSVDTIGAVSETSCVISASPVLLESAIAVPVSSELFPAQGIHELQSSSEDNGMDSLSAPWLVPNDCKALIRDSFPAATEFNCLQEWQDLAIQQTEINAGAPPDGPLIQSMFMGGAVFAPAVQQSFTAAALTQAAEAAVNTWMQTLQSTKITACLPPSLAGLNEADPSVPPPVQPKLHDISWNWDPGPDFFDVMDWGTTEACRHAVCLL